MKNQLGSGMPARLAAGMVTIALAFIAGCAGPRPPQFSPMPPPGQSE